LERFSYSLDLRDLQDTDIVIEAINEDYSLKSKIFKDLDKIVRPTSILASNTSSISITKVFFIIKIASNTLRPDKVIGMHFMNPVPIMKLIEIIKGLQTS
jgi:3-hydroxybutyryl-CoA dehydrogenase